MRLMPVSQQVELASIQRGPTIARLCGDAKCWPSAAATVVPSGVKTSRGFQSDVDFGKLSDVERSARKVV